MENKTLRDRICTILEKQGFVHETRYRSDKVKAYRKKKEVMGPNTIFFFVGKRGSIRIGTTLERSYSWFKTLDQLKGWLKSHESTTT